MKPLAIIPVFNEADILPWTIDHLQKQGCEVYVLDNWSTDHSPGIARLLGCEVERWPEEKPTTYDWTGILTRIEEIAFAHPAQWVMLHDADEIRRANYAGKTLAEGFEKIQAEGFNAVKFVVFTFQPTDSTYSGDPENHFRYFSPGHVDNNQGHVKAWLQGDQRVDIHSTGGHEVQFTGRQISPVAFVLKHYPIRSQEHGERKVLQERFPRYCQAELAQNWHVQYDEFRGDRPNFLRDPKELMEWSPSAR